MDRKKEAFTKRLANDAVGGRGVAPFEAGRFKSYSAVSIYNRLMGKFALSPRGKKEAAEGTE